MNGFGSGAALALGLLAVTPAVAQELEPENLTPVGCTVSVGIARAEKGEVDERFRGLPRSFGSVRLGSVELWKEQELKLQFGEWGRVPLPSGAELGVRPEKVRGRTMNMKLEWPDVVDTKLRLQNHSPVIVGPSPLPDGQGYLVIRVEPEFTDHLVPESEAEPQPVPVNDQR
jgi:hypothetical protein